MRTFVRSLWLQAAWSFRGMQSLGFAYALEPALARLLPEEEQRRQALGRHLEFFNTHPYMAAVVLGSCLRLEEEGGEGVEEAVRRLKGVLMGACGAVGDSFYWGGLKPLCILVALHAAYRGALWAPWLFLGLFAAANLGGRAYGFLEGYRRGAGAAEMLGELPILRWAQRAKDASALLLGGLLAAAAGPTSLVRWGVPAWAWVVGGGAAALGVAYLIGRGVRVVWLVYLAAALSGAIVAYT